MRVTIKRVAYRDDGIFSVLLADGFPFAVSLEHSFEGQPVIPPGVYTAVRGLHALSNLQPFETFEIMGVAGHSGLLFHRGNINADSHGCVLVGERFQSWTDGACAVGASGDGFAELMDRVRSLNKIEVEVIA